MIRTGPFQRLMHRLALLATLLMVVAPLVSRGLQAAAPVDVPDCTSAGLRAHALPAAAAMAMDGHAGHPAASMDMAMGMAMHAGSADADPMAGHAEHGFACDYCVLAARLLPWLAVALLVLPLLRAPSPDFSVSAPIPAASRWPAHAARGPPLHA